MLRDLVETASDQVPEGVAAEDVSAKQHDIDDQNDGSDADPEAIGETEGLHRVVDQKAPDDVGEPQKIAVEILQDRAESCVRPR